MFAWLYTHTHTHCVRLYLLFFSFPPAIWPFDEPRSITQLLCQLHMHALFLCKCIDYALDWMNLLHIWERKRERARVCEYVRTKARDGKGKRAANTTNSSENVWERESDRLASHLNSPAPGHTHTLHAHTHTTSTHTHCMHTHTHTHAISNAVWSLLPALGVFLARSLSHTCTQQYDIEHTATCFWAWLAPSTRAHLLFHIYMHAYRAKGGGRETEKWDRDRHEDRYREKQGGT